MKEEQHVVSHQPSPSEHFDCKEVTARQHIHMSGKKVLPRRDLAPLGSRGDTVATQYVPYRLIGHVMTQVGKGANDPVISQYSDLTRISRIATRARNAGDLRFLRTPCAAREPRRNAP